MATSDSRKSSTLGEPLNVLDASDLELHLIPRPPLFRVFPSIKKYLSLLFTKEDVYSHRNEFRIQYPVYRAIVSRLRRLRLIIRDSQRGPTLSRLRKVAQPTYIDTYIYVRMCVCVCETRVSLLLHFFLYSGCYLFCYAGTSTYV